MPDNLAQLNEEIAKRRTFAIISHPDAGKTTLTEKLLLFGGAIHLAGSVKSRKAERHARSDWMELEKKRGISVTTSVMQFPFNGKVINLLDTPGHADFSEDTYRTLTAVDSALMVIDAAKGVEQRTVKLLEVCRLRNTPIMTFINKLDRDAQDPIALLDEVEDVLGIQCAPVTWPIGMGKQFKGIYHLLEDKIYLYEPGLNHIEQDARCISGLDNPALDACLQSVADDLREEVELVKGASHPFDVDAYLDGKLTPVFFGSAMNNFGVRELLQAFSVYAPAPKAHQAIEKTVVAADKHFSAFVFKIQANMDPAHHDRIAFARVCSGYFHKGMKLLHVRSKKQMTVHNALTFMAGEREQATDAWPGDIIGIMNHGTIQIGDTFTDKNPLNFVGIPHFAPELFKRVRLADPLRLKALQKGLMQLSEEGAVQVFRPIQSNELIIGAVGSLQFDVVAHRLQSEYSVSCIYEGVQVQTARWITGEDNQLLEEFKNKCAAYLAYDAGDALTYLAPSRVNLSLTMERWPDLQFHETREHSFIHTS